MRRIIPGIILLAIVLVLLPSCQGDSGPAPDLVLWTGMGDQELAVLRKITEEFNVKNGLHVSIVKVPFNELKIKYQIAAPAGQGPDLVIGPQDWIGAMATADIIEPLTPGELTDEQKEGYNPKSLESMTYQGKMYGLPMLMETLAIIYNKKLVSKPPETMEELIQAAVDYKAGDKDRFGFFLRSHQLLFRLAFPGGIRGRDIRHYKRPD